MIRSVVIVGSGNLAEALARAVAASRFDLLQIYGRNRSRVAEVARIAATEAATDPGHLASADLYLIAVSDTAVTEVAAALPAPEGAIVAHTAGSVPIDALGTRFARRAVFYPFQTFTQGRPVDFARIPILTEASSPEVWAELDLFASGLSGKVVRADTQMRSQVHLAGVFACNFANHMYVLGAETLRGTGLGFDLLGPLIAETAAKALDSDDPRLVQTGPAVRHDRATQQRHLRMLADNPSLQRIYSSISEHIWEISRKTL